MLSKLQKRENGALSSRRNILKLIKQAGFNSLRVPKMWSAHLQEKSPFRIDPNFFKRIDWVITNASSNGLYAIINMHNYPEINQAAVREMHRQVGDLQIDGAGLARRGLLVRHLVLPHGLAGTDQVVHFLADEISRETYLNLMNQYHPAFNARQYPKLSRPLAGQEYEQAVKLALAAGLHRLDQRKQDFWL